jgi:glycosyltransferase involved in cell wall biosynthesis
MNNILIKEELPDLVDPQSGRMPLVTVSMAAYNSEIYIAEAIESILAQTYQNFEFIIVDDGSTDGTRAAIDRFTDPRIIKIFLDKNHGLISARNHIASLARGKYLALLDADDLAVPERLAVQVDLLEKGGVDLCGSDHWTLNQVSGKMRPSRQPCSNADILALLSVFSPLCNPSVMGRIDLFRQFPYKDSYRHAEDYC